MTRLVLLAAALLAAAPASAQQRHPLQPPPTRLANPPRAGIVSNPGLRPQGPQIAPSNGAGLISNNRGGVISDYGLGFRR